MPTRYRPGSKTCFFCYICYSPLTFTAGSLANNAIGYGGREGVVALAEAFKLMPGLTSVK